MSDNVQFPFVSVVIPMRNEEIYIEDCLKSLVNQDYPKDAYEIIVADGMSQDRSKEIVESVSIRNSNIFVLKNSDIYTSFGLNLGIRRSRGSIIIILGAHSNARPDFIRKNVEVMMTVNSDCVGGRIQSIGKTYSARVISSVMTSAFGVGDALFRYSEVEGYVDTVAFGAYKRAVFEKIGLFDEELLRDQDDEFNYRLRKDGGKIFMSPQISSSYYSRNTIIKLWKQYFLYGLWKVRVLQKHVRMMRLRQFIPSLFVLGLFGTLILSFLFPTFFYLFWLIVLSYLTFNLFFSIRIARRESWTLLLLLPVAFSVIHLSYGAGFVLGFLKFFSKWFDAEPDPPKL
jgi:glycosyltransferase involved in cell wall biosynthesis